MTENGTSTYDTDDLLGYGNVIFHHLPNATASSYQATLICNCICVGVLGLEILGNLDYDWALARRSGWLTLSKFQNRLAYYISRYLSITFLIMTVIFTVSPDLDCGPFAKAEEVMWLCPLLCVDFIFLQRTLALYTGDKVVYAILYAFFTVDIGLAICVVIWFGFGFHIPDSHFCAFHTASFTQPHATLFIAYCVVINALDTLILFLTLHRLIDGGILALPQKMKKSCVKMFKGKNSNDDTGLISQRESIAALLMRQGLHYYAILELTRLGYMIVYYTHTDGNSTYIVLCSSLLATIGPLLANRLFRETSEFIRSKTTIRSNSDQLDRNNHMDEANMLSLPLTSSNSMRAKSPYPTKSSSCEDKDEQEFRGIAKTTKYINNDNNEDDDNKRSRHNTSGLKIYVSENRMSSFVDDFETRREIARLPALYNQTQHDSSYLEPPSASITLVNNNQRPFHDTLSISVVSPPSSPSRAAMLPPNPSFDIRVKQPNSPSVKKSWF